MDLCQLNRTLGPKGKLRLSSANWDDHPSQKQASNGITWVETICSGPGLMAFWRYNCDQNMIPPLWVCPVCGVHFCKACNFQRPFSQATPLLTSGNTSFSLPLLSARTFQTLSPRASTVVEPNVQHPYLCCFRDIIPSQSWQDGPLL